MSFYHFRAWLLNEQGEPTCGVEEEFICKVKGRVVQCAWARAAKHLLGADIHNSGDAIEMEFIKEGRMSENK